MRALLRWLRRTFFLVVVVAMGSPELRADTSVAVVVSAEWKDVAPIDLVQLRKIYLGKTTRWSGHRLVCVQPVLGNPTRDLFRKRVLQRSVEELEEYWIWEALRGGAVPPWEFLTEGEVVDEIRRSPGRMGYVDARILSTERGRGLRTVPLLIGGSALLPTDPNYPLRFSNPRNPSAHQPGGSTDSAPP